VPPIPLKFRYAAPLLCGKAGSQTFNLSYPLLTIKHLKSLRPVMHFSPDKQDLTILKPRTPPQYTRTNGVITPQPYTAARLSSLHRPTRPPPRAKATINRAPSTCGSLGCKSAPPPPSCFGWVVHHRRVRAQYDIYHLRAAVFCPPSISLPHSEAAPFDPYPSSFLPSAGPLTDTQRLPRRL
jgi:hypothetical protein